MPVRAWVGRVVVATAMVGTGVLAQPGVASAAVALADRTVVVRSVPDDYTFGTVSRFWSVVAVHSQGNDYDMTLFNAANVVVGSSAWGTSRTDFVAIDSNVNRQPLGAYRTAVRRFSGTGSYWVQLRQGQFVTSLPVPAWDGVNGAGDPDLAFAVLPASDVVTITDIFLTGGQRFWAHSTSAGGRLFLLESTTSSATWVQSRSEAVATANWQVVDGCTQYTAKVTGWHGLLMIGDRQPTNPTPGEGTGHALHRFDPAKPVKCPVKNFPGFTPPP